MANALFDGGREGILDDSIAMSTASVKCLLATSGYTPNLATHRNVSDVTSGNIVVRSSALGSKTFTAGVFDAADVTFPAVTGSAVAYIILYTDSGSDATSRLLACIDTATGLPVTPNGGDISVTWDNGANKVFKL